MEKGRSHQKQIGQHLDGGLPRLDNCKKMHFGSSSCPVYVFCYDSPRGLIKGCRLYSVEVTCIASEARFDWVQLAYRQFINFVSFSILIILSVPPCAHLYGEVTLVHLTGFKGGNGLFYYRKCLEQRRGHSMYHIHKAGCVSTDGHSKASSMCPLAMDLTTTSWRGGVHVLLPKIFLRSALTNGMCGRREMCI